MIRVDGLSKHFRSGRSTKQVLEGVSLSIPEGAAVSVAGKSGSGKTTLLNCIGGLETPDSGSVSCFGREIHALSRKERSAFQRRCLGVVFQFGNLLPYLTVYENIAFPLALNRTTPAATKERIAALLETLGMPEMAKSMPHELSGGETQRIAFARAIAHSPRLLLADEPTASLDTDTGSRLVKTMFHLCRQEGCTVIMSTHDQSLIGLSDQTITLLDGKIVGK